MVSLRKAIGILFGVVFLANIYAQSVTVDIISYPSIVLPEKLIETDLPIKVLISLNSEGYRIIDPTLYVYITREDGKIIYYDSMYVNLNEGANTLNLYIPGRDIVKNLREGDGSVKLSVKLLITFSNENETKTLTKIDEVNISIKQDTEAGDIDVVYISPNLTEFNEFSRRTYSFIVGLKNDGVETADVSVYLRIYDEYNIRKINLINYLTLNPKDYTETRFDVNFGILDPGYYKLVLEVYKGDTKVYEREYPIVVDPIHIAGIKVYDVEIYPPNYKPGDLVAIKMLLRNVLNKPLSVKTIVLSKDLNIYRELNLFTLEPKEVKEFKVIVPIPKDTTPGEKEVTIRFIYDSLTKQEYTVKLEIPKIRKAEETKILEANIYGPKEVLVDENVTLTLEIKTFVEDLIPVKIEAHAENSEIVLENETVIVGGYGLIKDIKLKLVGKIPGTDKLTIKIIDQNTGKVLDESEYKYIVKGAVIGKGLALSKEVLTVLIVAVILVIALILLLRKRGEEEKPSE